LIWPDFSGIFRGSLEFTGSFFVSTGEVKMACQDLRNTAAGTEIQQALDKLVFGNESKAEIKRLDLCYANEPVLYFDIFLRWRQKAGGVIVYSAEIKCNERVVLLDPDSWKTVVCCTKVLKEEFCVPVGTIVAAVLKYIGAFVKMSELVALSSAKDTNFILSLEKALKKAAPEQDGSANLLPE
jgi:hypothetical protein